MKWKHIFEDHNCTWGGSSSVQDCLMLTWNTQCRSVVLSSQYSQKIFPLYVMIHCLCSILSNFFNATRLRIQLNFFIQCCMFCELKSTACYHNVKTIFFFFMLYITVFSICILNKASHPAFPLFTSWWHWILTPVASKGTCRFWWSFSLTGAWPKSLNKGYVFKTAELYCKCASTMLRLNLDAYNKCSQSSNFTPLHCSKQQALTRSVLLRCLSTM